MTKNYTLRPARIQDLPLLKPMVAELYIESGEEPIPEQHIERTVREFANHPNKGAIFVIEKERIPFGYLILATFWVNEYGGTILSVDELFLLPEYRNQGIGTEVLQSLIEERPYDCVGIYLEHTPQNGRAGNLYEKLGFKPYENHSLFLDYKTWSESQIKTTRLSDDSH